MYERAYDHCPHCHQGICPTDSELALVHKQTPGACEVIALLGVLEPFEEAAQQTLPRLCGLNASPSTVQRLTETVGEDVVRRRGRGETIGPEDPWEWHRDATGKTVAYCGLDATGVRQQGPHAEKAEGRMPWVGTVFNPQPTHEEQRRRRMWECRYVSGLMSLPERGRQMRRECQAVGVDQADRVIALTDGGVGLENCLLDVLGGVAQEIVFILDFWHASEHLQEFANVLILDEARRHQQVQVWCHQLKHQGGQALLNEIGQLELSQATPLIRESHRQLLGYLRNNVHRMDYPRSVKNGWQIGSGKVESACKSVVCQRLKGPGMRWRSYGTTALCQLRALYKSQPDLWKHSWTNFSPT